MLSRSRGEKIFAVCNYLFLTIAALLCLLPLINVIFVSLSSMEAASSGQVTIYPIGFNITAYKNIVRQPLFIRTFLNSFLRLLVGVPLNMALTIMAAYPLSMSKSRLCFRQFYVWFFVITMLVSGGLIPTYLTIKSLGC